ncbi:MAG: Rrf2 family transcriptional regulator [Synechococcaceae cyanobacterium ELA182]
MLDGRTSMLSRSAIHAIRALLELAETPQRWRSVHDLAAAQQLPEPLLEQLMLRLRRAAIVEARRGRQGGYRLARPAAAIPLATILAALTNTSAGPGPGPDQFGQPDTAAPDATARVTVALERRLRQALERELARCTLEELLHDLRSARASLSDESGLLLG